ncbi:MAG: hypothetical protein V4517_14275 [Pseudomonadota bacterium]
MTIESREAAAALSDIEDVVRRVRQSRIYNFASLMLMMWGALVFAGYLGSFLLPRQAGYIWIAANVTGVAGSFAVSASGYRKTGVRTFDVRMLIALLLYFAFGFLCTSVLGQFTPRQMGAFWPIYFMLLYIIAGLWFGHAFVAIGLGISVLAMVGYYFTGNWFELWMAFVDGGGLMLGGLWMRRS